MEYLNDRCHRDTRTAEISDLIHLVESKQVNAERLRKYVAEQVKLAYEAGYHRLNLLTGDCVVEQIGTYFVQDFDIEGEDKTEYEEVTITEIIPSRWHQEDLAMEYESGDRTLPNIYAQLKGFE